MIYAGSIIQIMENSADVVKEILRQYPQIEVFTESEDQRQLVVAFEEESSESLEDLCKQLKENEEIIEISHTNFYFGEEVERMMTEEN
ncbi:MAG: hypothetical protein GY940_29620 [bacterium]|nr:hypothetical protein [bacterium]